MTSQKYQLTRRKFMIAGSAAMAAPLLTTLPGAGGIPEAEAADFKKGTDIYFVTGDCVGCHVCKIFCPEQAVFYGERRMAIDQDKCVHCGTCYDECPVSAVTVTTV